MCRPRHDLGEAEEVEQSRYPPGKRAQAKSRHIEELPQDVEELLPWCLNGWETSCRLERARCARKDERPRLDGKEAVVANSPFIRVIKRRFFQLQTETIVWVYMDASYRVRAVTMSDCLASRCALARPR
jgi:hypothetical protein